jgi:hypothetical protein
LRERELVAATSCDAATTSASSVTRSILSRERVYIRHWNEPER